MTTTRAHAELLDKIENLEKLNQNLAQETDNQHEKLNELNSLIESMNEASQIQTSNYAELEKEFITKQEKKEPIEQETTENNDSLALLQKNLLKEIPLLQNDTNRMNLTMWIEGMQVFLDCIYPQGVNDSLAFLFAKTKLSPPTRYELSRQNDTITGWTSLQKWLNERRALVLDSDHAKVELRSQKQNGIGPRAYFQKLQEVSMNITAYDGLEHDIREAFVSSLDSRIQPSVRKDYEKYRAQCFRDGTEMSNEWLIQITVIEDNHTPKPKPSVSSVKSKSKAPSATTSSAASNVPNVSNVTVVPPEFTKGRITDEGRDWMRAHGGCFFCRTLGHVVKDCPRFANFKLENPDKVRHPQKTSNPLPIVTSPGGEELEVLSSEVSINVFSATLSPSPKLVQFDLGLNIPTTTLADASLEPSIHPSHNDLTPIPLIEDEILETFTQPFYDETPLLDLIDDSRPWQPSCSSMTPTHAANSSSHELIDDDHLHWPVWSLPGNRMLFPGTVTQHSSSPRHAAPFSVTARVLVDSACDGMVMSLAFAQSNYLPLDTVASRPVQMADHSTVYFQQQCTVSVRVGNFRKDLTFAVGPIAEDLIFGLPFFNHVQVNADWANHRFSFISASGTKHNWYGVDHKSRSCDVASPIFLCSLQEFARNRNSSDIFRVNIEQIASIHDQLQAAPPPNSEQIGSFMEKLDPQLQDILTPFLDTVLTDPPNFDGIPERPEDQRIELKPGAQVKNRPVRRLSEKEREALLEKLKELLDRGFIQASKSQYGANVLFAKKKDGGLRLCIDYREINKATVKDRTPLPSHAEMRERVHGAQFLSTVDVVDAFHMIRMHPDDCHKTAFACRFGLFEFTVSPFGLTNSPASFMRMQNRIFFDLVDQCVVYYVDDILIYSSTYEQHLQDIKEVFTRLEANKLHVKLSKCLFLKQELPFCGVNVSTEGFTIGDSAKQALCDYPMKEDNYPANKYVQEFTGSVRFFQDFIPWIADIAVPLYRLTQKDSTEQWNVNHVSAMRVIQFHLTNSPVLGYFDPARPQTFTYTDASAFAIGGWLGQTDDTGKTIIIAFWSRKLIPAELNYPVHEREFLALYAFVKKFRIYLHGVPFLAHVDHRSLEHMQDQPNLSARQVHWIQELQEFEFTVEYLPGARNTFSDWLSRRPDFAKMTCPACRHCFDSAAPRINAVAVADDIIDLSSLAQLQSTDPFCAELDTWLTTPASIPPRKIGYFKAFSKNLSGIWLFKTAIVVPVGPLRLKCMQFFHDRTDHGHFGFKKVMDSMRSTVYWPTMMDDLYKYIESCDICQRTKIHTEKTQGLLIPLAIPETRFERLNIDFANMPLSFDGFDTMAVISDKLSKLIEVVPCKSTMTAGQFAQLFYRNWFLKGFGMPASIISDRDKLFVSRFWTTFCNLTGISRDLSTSRHQQTDGGAEVVIRILKTALKGIVNHRQSDWTQKLSEIQFAYNNSTHSATGFTPFYLAYAFLPHTFPCFQEAKAKEPLFKAFAQYERDLNRAHLSIFKSQQRMENAYNRNHHAVVPLEVGDFALLSRDGINWIGDTEVSRKLLQPFIGPFEVIAVDSNHLNFTLRLPRTMQCHPIFHQSLLRKWIPPNSNFPDRPTLTNDLPPDLHEDGYELFEVEKVLDSRYRGRGSKRTRQFLVRWKGYDPSRDSWEPEEFLATCPDLLSDFLANSTANPPDGVLTEQVIRRSLRHLSTGSVSVLRSTPSWDQSIRCQSSNNGYPSNNNGYPSNNG